MSLQDRNYLSINANGLSGGYIVMYRLISYTHYIPLCLFSKIEISSRLLTYILLHLSLSTGVVD